MKRFALLCLAAALVILLCPIFMLPAENAAGQPPGGLFSLFGKEKGEVPEDGANPSLQTGGSIKVLLSDSGEVVTLSEKDYLYGAVAAEMNATYHEEALKAQAVACHTYALRIKNQQRQSPDETLKGADITDSPAKHQGYFSVEKQKEKWGEKYDAYADKIKKAVDEVADSILTYDGELVLAAYHAISPGQTESAAAVWGKDYACLRPVNSTGDKLSPNYSSTLVLTAAQFKEAAEKLKDVALPENTTGWVQDIQKSESGTVTSLTIGGKRFTGMEARGAFDLRSAAFDLEFKNDSFVFSVFGYGHGVGMSQYGADYMARQGSKWDEILRYYYTGAKIEKEA